LSEGFKADGGVDLTDAKIGSLDCDDGQFIGKGETPVLNAASAKIDGGVYFNVGFSADGEIRFLGAYVARDFQWSGAKFPEKAILDLRQARVWTLLNPQSSWPIKGNLRVSGFVYDQLDDRAISDAKVQLGWLQLQPKDRLLSEPFEQLAGVLRKMGLEEDAKRVMIAKNEEHAKYVQWRPEWLWWVLWANHWLRLQSMARFWT